MSTLPAVTMQDLELEHAELLPSRETLCSWRGHGCGGGFSQAAVTQGATTNQVGLLNISANGNNILNNIVL